MRQACVAGPAAQTCQLGFVLAAVEQLAYAKERCIRRLQASSPMRSTCVVLRCRPTQSNCRLVVESEAPLSYKGVASAAAAAAAGHAGEAD